MLALAALLAGCGAGDAEAAAETALRWGTGALEQFEHVIWPDRAAVFLDEASDDAFTESEFTRLREEYLAACMAEHGFEYIPNIGFNRPAMVARDPAYEDIDWGTREWAETFGFQIIRNPWIQVAAEPWFDPNQAQIDAMTPEQWAAWELAMFGPQASEGVDLPVSARGCLDRSWAVNHGVPGEHGAFAPLVREINSFWSAFGDDSLPEHQILNSEWRACMDGHGFGEWETEMDLRDALDLEWRQIEWNNFDASTFNWDAGLLPEFEVDEGPSEAFFRREQTLAIYSFECSQALNLEQRRIEISHRLQEAFVEQHRDELEAWVRYLTDLRAQKDGGI